MCNQIEIETKTETPAKTFEEALAAYLALVNARHDAYCSSNEFKKNECFVEVRGKRYAKVCQARIEEGGPKVMSAHSFVDVATGNIFKASSWSAPAKHRRGNVFESDGAAALSGYSVRYL